jgi:hypothetical protein
MADTEYGTQNRIVGFKAESTAGTYAAPLAADFNIEAFDITTPEIDYSMANLGKPANGTLFEGQMRSGQYKVTMTAKTALTHSGDATDAPAVGKLLESAGLIKSGGTTVPVVYTYDGSMPCNGLSAVVSDMNCGSAAVSVDRKVRGIQSNLVISAGGIGQEVALEFSMSGGFEDEADNAAPIKALQGLDELREKFLETVFTIDGQAYIPLSFSLDLGNSVSFIGDPNKEGGVLKSRITGKAGKLTVPVYKIDLATSGLPASILTDETFSAVKFAMKYYDLEITDANLSARKDGDAEGIVSEELEFQVRGFTLTAKAVA